MNSMMTAEQVAEALDISVETVYAYVSRGLLRSEPDADDPRRRRYPVDDVRRLQQRKQQRRQPEATLRAALHWGVPLIETQLTAIGDGHYRYRGVDALHLAGSETFERVAALLWHNDLDAALDWPQLPAAGAVDGDTLIARWQTKLATAGASDLGAYITSKQAIARSGMRIIRLMTEVVATEQQHESIATTLQHAWRPDQPSISRAINSALIVCADHELNVSAFTARCIASARATPYQAIIGALAAFSGGRHGGASELAAAFLSAAAAAPAATIRRRLQQDEPIPGFGHPLYPDGDPRWPFLLALAEEHATAATWLQLGHQVSDLVWQHLGLRPNLDFGLVVLSNALELPSDAALALFAIGRAAGWIAHVIEQIEAGALIRPRARYTG